VVDLHPVAPFCFDASMHKPDHFPSADNRWTPGARFADDPALGPATVKWRGMRPLSPVSLYEYLIVAIILQNAVIRRSIHMLQALFEAHGTLLAFDGQALYAFWTPEGLDEASEEALRRLKVGYRARSIRRVTDAFVRGEINELAVHYLWEDLFWKRVHEPVPWLEKLIRR
jgi:3-methyladenine DNA glycosylase/8-oxoguanine DNA glycosylase